MHASRGWVLREEVPGPRFLAAEVAAFAAGLAAGEHWQRRPMGEEQGALPVQGGGAVAQEPRGGGATGASL